MCSCEFQHLSKIQLPNIYKGDDNYCMHRYLAYNLAKFSISSTESSDGTIEYLYSSISLASENNYIQSSDINSSPQHSDDSFSFDDTIPYPNSSSKIDHVNNQTKGNTTQITM